MLKINSEILKFLSLSFLYIKWIVVWGLLNFARAEFKLVLSESASLSKKPLFTKGFPFCTPVKSWVRFFFEKFQNVVIFKQNDNVLKFLEKPFFTHKFGICFQLKSSVVVNAETRFKI